MLLSFSLVFASLVGSTLGSTCKYIQAQANDGCYNLAQRCGISQSDLVKYNTESDFCNNILLNEYVCCSAGSLPDFSPKPYSNGTCYTYTIQPNDLCSTIETANKMKSNTIPGYNNETWGWSGCNDLQHGQRICLSTGTPPFPAEMANANCGPQVPGTVQPSNMAPKNWTNLNPCPLNACCDIWGQCGITPEFCTANPADTGAPGTAKNGSNGCISNCGTSITNNKDKPADIKRIGYFENWNSERKCLNMDVSKFQGNSYYTHVHWAFANVTDAWTVDVSGAKDSFDSLLKLTDIKRIVSFGGWGFSTSDYTFNIFRNGVKDGNRQVWAKNVVDFITSNNLDGVDFDWEYPGAQDIPGIPPDSTDSGKNYLEFLKLVRSQLPSDKTMSIAAPASYWYLKYFPIKDIASIVDYIVYMTYDLHGQWDYNNTFADPGCPNGGCLRSQVNKTETEYALSMITKAGVNANKVVAGLALYGRSFEMKDPSCTGPECEFTGPLSGAAKGACTDTAGYISNYEIFEILAQAQNPDLYGNITISQSSSDVVGDVLIYNKTNWISWLSPSSYASRRSWTDGLNFGGTSDWAVDLNETYSDNGTGSSVDSGYDDDDDYTPCDYTKTFKSLDDLSSSAGDLRSDCVAVYALQVLIDMLDTAYANYTDVNNGYDDLFGYYVTYIDKLVPNILQDAFMFNITSDDENWKNVGALPELGYGMDYFTCKYSDTTFPCNQAHGTYERYMYQTTTSLSLTDSDGYSAGLAKAGLSPDWVVFGDYQIESDAVSPHGGRKGYYKFTDFPIKNDSMVVPNPKDIVTKALPSIPTLKTSMQATLLDMKLSQWRNGSLTDPAEAYSTAVFMLMQAVDSMAQAKELGKKEEQEEEEEEKRKKNFILMIVSVVLMFVPVVGEEIAAATGFASLARAIALAGELGNGALAIYDTVEDPSSAVVNILGMLLGVGSIAKVARDGEGIASVAKIRRAMKADDISSMGKIFSDNDGKLQSIVKACKLT